MTTSPSHIHTRVDPLVNHPLDTKPDCCEKCGGTLQHRQMIVNRKIQWIWQCKICRFHQPA